MSIQVPINITLNSVEITSATDNFEKKTISAKIKNLPYAVVLFSGNEEYTAAGDWTFDTLTTQASAVLSSSNINWATK